MRLQPDIIKLDRALTTGVDTDPAKAPLISSFVRYARDIDATVCAEGIETLDELELPRRPRRRLRPGLRHRPAGRALGRSAARSKPGLPRFLRRHPRRRARDRRPRPPAGTAGPPSRDRHAPRGTRGLPAPDRRRARRRRGSRRSRHHQRRDPTAHRQLKRRPDRGRRTRHRRIRLSPHGPDHEPGRRHRPARGLRPRDTPLEPSPAWSRPARVVPTRATHPAPAYRTHNELTTSASGAPQPCFDVRRRYVSSNSDTSMPPARGLRGEDSGSTAGVRLWHPAPRADH